MSQRGERVADGILDAIGNTPLVRLRRYLDGDQVELIVKVEAANPGGSAKDRPARMMIEAAIAAGQIAPGGTVIESSSGNMAIGMAQACRYHGLQFICVADPRIQSDNLVAIEALGGRIEMVRQQRDGDFLTARVARVCELLEQIPDSYWPNQYANPLNPAAHYRGTISEIDDALEGQYDVLFVATSSLGTLRGCREFLRARGRSVELVAVDAVGSVLFDGAAGERKIPGLGAGKIPRLATTGLCDRVIRVGDLQCVVGCRRAAHREAMLVGGSAGGVLEAVRSDQGSLARGRCVAILHDSGTRYLNNIYNDQWVQQSLNCDPTTLAQLIDQPPLVLVPELTA